MFLMTDRLVVCVLCVCVCVQESHHRGDSRMTGRAGGRAPDTEEKSEGKSPNFLSTPATSRRVFNTFPSSEMLLMQLKAKEPPPPKKKKTRLCDCVSKVPEPPRRRSRMVEAWKQEPAASLLYSTISLSAATLGEQTCVSGSLWKH